MYFAIFLLSLAPGFEGRYSIALAYSLKLDPLTSVIVVMLGVVVLAVALALLVERVDSIITKLAEGEGALSSVAKWIVKRVLVVRSKARRYVEKWGVLGLALFVAVPLPMTGMWTGALVGYILGFSRKRLGYALAIGGILSVLVVLVPSMVISKLGVGKP